MRVWIQKREIRLEVRRRRLLDVIRMVLGPVSFTRQTRVQPLASLCVHCAYRWLFIGTQLSSDFEENTLKRNGVGRPNYFGNVRTTVSRFYVSQCAAYHCFSARIPRCKLFNHWFIVRWVIMDGTGGYCQYTKVG